MGKYFNFILLRKILRVIKRLLPNFLPIPYLYKFNLKMLLLPKHHWTQYLQGTYEPETFEKIKEIFKNKQIKSFWDIGANVGIYSVFIAKRYSCNIYAFEPSKKYHSFLKLNTTFFKKVKAYNFGIGSINKKEKIILTSEPGSNYIARNKFDKNIKNSEICELRTIKKLSNIKAPNLVKIDVEGFEYEVLNNLLDFFKKNKTNFILEIDEDNLERYSKNKKDIFHLLKSRNYFIERISKSNNYYCYLKI